MFIWIPHIINGIITFLYMALHISGINAKKPRIILAWLILAGIQWVFEIIFIFVIWSTWNIYMEYFWLIHPFILKPLALLTTLIITGFHYENIKNKDQAGEVIPILRSK